LRTNSPNLDCAGLFILVTKSLFPTSPGDIGAQAEALRISGDQAVFLGVDFYFYFY